MKPVVKYGVYEDILLRVSIYGTKCWFFKENQKMDLSSTRICHRAGENGCGKRWWSRRYRRHKSGRSHHFCAQAHMKTHILCLRCPWPPGCFLGASWMPLGRLLRFFRLTFWPRFHHPGNYQRNQLQKKHLEALGPPFCTEFRCASCWHSHLSRSAIWWFFYQGTLKSLKNHKIHKNRKMHAPKFQGRVFSEVAEAPQAST